jgi:hypothetical protein
VPENTMPRRWTGNIAHRLKQCQSPVPPFTRQVHIA